MSETTGLGPRCALCKSGIDAISARGAYLKRVNPVGEAGIWGCEPDCDGQHGTQEDALIAALEADDELV